MTKKKLNIVISIVSLIILVAIYLGINYSFAHSRFFSSVSLNDILWNSLKVAWQILWGLTKMFCLALWNMVMRNWWVGIIIIGSIVLFVLRYFYYKKDDDL